MKSQTIILNKYVVGLTVSLCVLIGLTAKTRAAEVIATNPFATQTAYSDTANTDKCELANKTKNNLTITRTDGSNGKAIINWAAIAKFYETDVISNHRPVATFTAVSVPSANVENTFGYQVCNAGTGIPICGPLSSTSEALLTAALTANLGGSLTQTVPATSYAHDDYEGKITMPLAVSTAPGVEIHLPGSEFLQITSDLIVKCTDG